jgi:HSP20 family protein
MQLIYGEAQYPSYRRQFTLSRELDASRIDASLKDGVLKLSIPKLEEAKPRRVEVRIG